MNMLCIYNIYVPLLLWTLLMLISAIKCRNDKNKAYCTDGTLDPGLRVFRISPPPAGLLGIPAEILGRRMTQLHNHVKKYAYGLSFTILQILIIWMRHSYVISIMFIIHIHIITNNIVYCSCTCPTHYMILATIAIRK